MSRTVPFALPAMLAAALAACSAQTPPPEPAAPPAADLEPSCGADKLVSYVGHNATDDVVTAIGRASGAKSVRVIKPDTAVTMDYRPDRLNIDVDANGVIKAFRCT